LCVRVVVFDGIADGRGGRGHFAALEGRGDRVNHGGIHHRFVTLHINDRVARVSGGHFGDASVPLGWSRRVNSTRQKGRAASSIRASSVATMTSARIGCRDNVRPHAAAAARDEVTVLPGKRVLA
jgi:hypothetical protein